MLSYAQRVVVETEGRPLKECVELLTPRYLCERYGLHKSTISAWRKTLGLPSRAQYENKGGRPKKEVIVDTPGSD